MDGVAEEAEFCGPVGSVVGGSWTGLSRRCCCVSVPAELDLLMTGGVDNRSDTAGMDADLITPPLLLMPAGTLSNWPAGRRCTTRTRTHTQSSTCIISLVSGEEKITLWF